MLSLKDWFFLCCYWSKYHFLSWLKGGNLAEEEVAVFIVTDCLWLNLTWQRVKGMIGPSGLLIEDYIKLFHHYLITSSSSRQNYMAVSYGQR